MSPATFVLFAAICAVAGLLVRDLMLRARAARVPASDAPPIAQAVPAAVPDEEVRP